MKSEGKEWIGNRTYLLCASYGKIFSISKMEIFSGPMSYTKGKEREEIGEWVNDIKKLTSASQMQQTKQNEI